MPRYQAVSPKNQVALAMRRAGRRVLLRALRDAHWSLTDASVALGLGCAGNVYRYLISLAPKTYLKAKRDGRIIHGYDPRRKRRATKAA